MTMDGAECLSFGIQMPIADIVKAATAHRVDVVILSFSPAYPRSRTAEGLAELRQVLPAATGIWVGGGGVERLKRVPDQVMVVRSLADVSTEIGRWRHQAETARSA